MADPLETLKAQLTPNLADPEKCGPLLKAVLEIAGESGSKELKKQVKQWIADIKDKEGV